LFKTIAQPDGDFVLVTREQYDEIDFCPNYIVLPSGKIVQKKIDSMPAKVLQLDSTGFRTIKDNNIFRVDDAYLGDTDSWSIGYTNE
jgi:hypothetical protein